MSALYSFTDDEANILQACSVAPLDVRLEWLREYAARHGTEAILRLLAQLIGAADALGANGRTFAEDLLIQTGNVFPATAEVIKFPSFAGLLMGARLANRVTNNGLCDGCAYRCGSIANMCSPTTSDADGCADDNEAFLCHEKMDEQGNPNELCAGHAQAVKRIHGADTPVLRRAVFRCGNGGLE